MASNNHFRSRLRDINNTGFGTNSIVEGGRLINSDGSANLKKTGLPIWQRTSIYHTLLKINRYQFFLVIFAMYSAVNFFFAMLYLIIGVEHLSGTLTGVTMFEKFCEAFFFSSQTLTTVGYGRVAPTGFLTNCVASLESLLGIIVFAVVTGLIYGRFSRPRAYLMFSDNIIIAPHKHGKALMLRIASYKNNHLTDVEAVLTMAMHFHEHGKAITKYYPLTLEISKVTSLALSWTLVHQINEESPLYNLTQEQVSEMKMEVIVVIKGFDDHFSNIVQQRTSYVYQQFVFGAKFLPMFTRASDGDYTILDLNKINAFEHVEIPEPVLEASAN